MSIILSNCVNLSKIIFKFFKNVKSSISALISSKSEEVVEVVEVVDEEAGVELLTVQNLIRFHTLFENTWSTKSLESVYIKC